MAKTKRSGGRIALIVLAAVCVLALAAYLVIRSLFILQDGQLVRRDSQTVTVDTDAGLDVNALLRLENPESLDLRGTGLAPADFDRLRAAFPACDIRWDVPIGGAVYDSAAEELTLSAFSADEVPLFHYFTALQRIDARGLDCWEALSALSREFPELAVDWSVSLGGQSCDPAASSLALDGAVTGGELLEKLAAFPNLTQVAVTTAQLSEEEQTALLARYPGVAFSWTVALCGRTVSSGETALSFAGETGLDLDELIRKAPLLGGVKTLDLTGCGFSNEDMGRVEAAYPGADVIWRFTIYGVEVGSTDEEVDLSNIPIADTAEIENALPYMPHLRKVVMCDCGISDEDMDALNRRYDDVRFVWMVHFGTYYLRTDETSFIASLFKGSEGNYCNLYDDMVQPLRYCTDLVALDLGHMSFKKCDFVSGMTHLRFLILADGKVDDISPLANLKELYFCELFLDPFTDISPLLQCPALRHLNICHCEIADVDDLLKMTWLDRLWFMSEYLSYEDLHRLLDGLPDTQKQLGMTGTATGGTWRYDPSYYEMRDLLGVYYMEGGTEAPH